MQILNKLVLFLIALALIPGCTWCGDATCKAAPTPPEFVKANEKATVSLDNGKLIFHSPAVFTSYKYNALERIKVYDIENIAIVWEIQSKILSNYPKTFTSFKESAQLHAQVSPIFNIAYGENSIDGTEVTIEPLDLKPDVVYSMTGSFRSYNEGPKYDDKVDSTYMKATFKLVKNENNRLEVLALPTKYCDAEYPLSEKYFCKSQ